jgi:hypothetical protein
MEPIHPLLRDELKRVHPGLTDADIDRYEELTSLRFTLDPTASAEEIRDIDVQRARLVQTKMPRLAELENAFAARAAQTSRRVKTPPRIEVKPPGGREPGRD